MPKPQDPAETLRLKFEEHWAVIRKLHSKASKKLNRAVVHDLRIESRRAIAVWELCRDWTSRAHFIREEKRLKRELHALREIRDLQVEKKRYSRFAAHPSQETQSILKFLNKKNKKAKKKVTHFLKTHYLKKKPPFIRARVTSATVKRILKQRTLKQLIRSREALEAARIFDLNSIHQARIQIKKLRYMIESVEMILGPRGGLPLSRKKLFDELQRRLGKIQDLHVLRDQLASLNPPKKFKNERAKVEKELTNEIRRLYRFIPKTEIIWPTLTRDFGLNKAS